MPNAPVCNGVPGAWLDVLRKCLIGGWTAFDVPTITVENGIGSFTLPQNSGTLPDYCRITLSGCDEPLLNVTHTIIKGYAGGLCEFETNVADGTYGGSTKGTPEAAGWELLYTGTNQAVIRSGNLESSRAVVQITDTNATTCSFEFAYDATNVSNLIDSSRLLYNYDKCFLKSFNAVANDRRPWFIVADNTTVYMFNDTVPIYNDVDYRNRNFLLSAKVSYFGDYIYNHDAPSLSFGFYFQAINAGATSNNLNYIDGNPAFEYFYVSNWNNGRSAVMANLTKFWYWRSACMMAPRGVHVYNNESRISGTSSRLYLPNIRNLESSYRKIPVVAVLAYDSGVYNISGTLPGMYFSDYYIRQLFAPFTSSKDPNSDRIFTYMPISNNNRSSNTISADLGYLPFIMHKRWDE
jgi:hypothetical protein